MNARSSRISLFCTSTLGRGGKSWEPNLVVFCQVDVNYSFLRFLDFRSSIWAPKSHLHILLFGGEGGPQDGVSQEILAMIIGKMSGLSATQSSTARSAKATAR